MKLEKNTPQPFPQQPKQKQEQLKFKEKNKITSIELIRNFLNRVENLPKSGISTTDLAEFTLKSDDTCIITVSLSGDHRISVAFPNLNAMIESIKLILENN